MPYLHDAALGAQPRPDIPPPIREREVDTPVELPDPNRENPTPDTGDPTDAGDLQDEDSELGSSHRETKG